MRTRLRIVGLTSLFLLLPAVGYAVTDWYTDWIIWTPGAGQKPQVNCESGYYAFAIENYDEGRNTVSNYMKCGEISDYAPGVDIDHASCVNTAVTWSAGAGAKPWAHCPNGKYAVGFSIYDYGGRNEGINRMRCCALQGASSSHGDSYQTSVSWFPGYGPKGFTECDYGYVITGIRLKDYGENNQGVYEIRCSHIDL